MSNLGLVPNRDRANQLVKAYGQSQDYIRQKIFSVTLENYTDKLALEVKQDINLEVQKLNVKAMRWSKVSIPESYEESRRSSTKILEDGGQKKDPNYKREKHKITSDAATAETQKVLLKGNRSIMPQINLYLNIIGTAKKDVLRAKIQELSELNAQVINEIILEGIGEEMTLKQISGEVAKYLRFQFKQGKFIKVKGRNYTLRYYSEMVSRTQMRITQSKATENTCKQYNNDLVQWSIHPQEYKDIECAPFAGKTYSWSGKSEKYKKIPAIPPTHPNCEHYLNAVPEELVAIEPERFPSTIKQKIPIGAIAS